VVCTLILGRNSGRVAKACITCNKNAASIIDRSFDYVGAGRGGSEASRKSGGAERGAVSERGRWYDIVGFNVRHPTVSEMT